MEDFPNCIHQSELSQILPKGQHLTWHNGQQGGVAILRKLDWAFGSQSFLMNWPQSQATFQARIHSDHSPIILTFMPSPAHHRGRFKFLNLWTDQDGYEEMIQAAWGMAVFGNPIYRLATKLRTLVISATFIGDTRTAFLLGFKGQSRSGRRLKFY
ncbi:hypothetical protein OIU85_013768 [Salix viminalis]|uniref:Endonuclease/exonuclease/phosphatase domain-containing protein n=1 Tax=Salix viminalis TaxID=40686 RepID=A0A9Q0NMG5_SALVM|nr:hypothetical protein OIU85_013768 [Salix viminalis]